MLRSLVGSEMCIRDSRKEEKAAMKAERISAKQDRVRLYQGGPSEQPLVEEPRPWVRHITSEDDDGVRPYADLKSAMGESRLGKFIAEGPETIKMLVRSDLEIESLLLKPSVLDKLLPEIERCRPDNPPQVLLCRKELMAEIVGYPIDRGSLGCGLVPIGRDLDWLADLLRRRDPARCRLLAVDNTCDAGNLGGMIRSASAFGADAVLVSDDSCDPWYRRSVRTSMGHICRVPVVRCPDLAGALAWLRTEMGVSSYAAVIDMDASLLHQISAVPASWCVVMGNEDTGISEPVRAACDTRVRIRMDPAVDSLNIGVAAGILLNGFCERETPISN
eukprot:TRINITY_DN6306_c0_g1_i4.p1 TRINITY_DN6306_c0_g1~~TRINITY_DN6306_c0_g1_i4.p1  ORF type:complete len:373 (+),score=77.25 TRINITY_DN6306_c0_g1_i4:122-1120(+)